MEKKKHTRSVRLAMAGLAALLPLTCLAQDGPLPHFGLGVSVGTLGVGVQAATAVTHSSNVRAGFNYFSYTGSSTSGSDNITFNGTLKLESAEVLFDQYLGRSFHISPGVVIYDGNQATGNASIPAGQTFTLNSVNYYSSAASPVTGTGSFTAEKSRRRSCWALATSCRAGRTSISRLAWRPAQSSPRSR